MSTSNYFPTHHLIRCPEISIRIWRSLYNLVTKFPNKDARFLSLKSCLREGCTLHLYNFLRVTCEICSNPEKFFAWLRLYNMSLSEVQWWTGEQWTHWTVLTSKLVKLALLLYFYFIRSTGWNVTSLILVYKRYNKIFPHNWKIDFHLVHNRVKASRFRNKRSANFPMIHILDISR